jgi:hypothetical protein
MLFLKTAICRDKGDLSHEMAFGRQTLRERGLHEKTTGQTKCSPTQRLALNTGGSLSFVRSFCLKAGRLSLLTVARPIRIDHDETIVRMHPSRELVEPLLRRPRLRRDVVGIEG